MIYVHGLDGVSERTEYVRKGKVLSAIYDNEAEQVKNSSLPKTARCHISKSAMSGKDGEQLGCIGGGGWVKQTTHHYTDYYLNRGNNNWEYSNTTYNGSTTEYVWVVSGIRSNMAMANYIRQVFSSGGAGPSPGSHAYRQLMEGNIDVPEDDRIITDGLTGKEACLNELLSSSKEGSFIHNLLKNFEGESEFDIKIVSKDKVFLNGEEVNGKTSFSSSSKVITIEISTDKAATRSALSVARTIIHEYVHAAIFRKVYTKESAPNGDAIFKNTYEAYESEIFKANVHHNTMAELYQESIAATLKELHSEKMNKDKAFISNNGASNLDIYYDALSWQGLRSEHEVIWEATPETRKKALNDALSKFDIASTKNCK